MTLYLNDLGLLCAVGNSKAEVLKRLLAGDRSGLVSSDEFGTRCIVGAVAAELPEIAARYRIYNCRNNRLLLAALSQIESTVTGMIARFGADRIGIVLGTSTSGVRNTELGFGVYGLKMAYCLKSFITSSSKWAPGRIFWRISWACKVRPTRSLRPVLPAARRLHRRGG